MDYSENQLVEISSRIHQLIDAFCVKELTDEPRTHLGASEIGGDCLLREWKAFRWIKRETHNARMLRLFNRGHLEEPRLIRWLVGAGFIVAPLNPATNKQWVFSDIGGHYGGSTDGLAYHPLFFPREYVITEFKTHNAKSFAKLRKEGVKKSKPRHFSQMSNYGAKFACRYGVYLGANKDDDDLHVEVVRLDWELANGLTERARYIITSPNPPGKMSGASPSNYKCKECPMLGTCFHHELPDKNCRSCRFAVPTDNGEWYCNQWRNVIPRDFIPTGCDAYRSVI